MIELNPDNYTNGRNNFVNAVLQAHLKHDYSKLKQIKHLTIESNLENFTVNIERLELKMTGNIKKANFFFKKRVYLDEIWDYVDIRKKNCLEHFAYYSITEYMASLEVESALEDFPILGYSFALIKGREESLVESLIFQVDEYTWYLESRDLEVSGLVVERGGRE